MTKKWSVALPISAVVYVDVEADDEESAIDKALEEGNYSLNDVDNWEAHRHIVQGNVCYAVYWDATAEQLADDEASA